MRERRERATAPLVATGVAGVVIAYLALARGAALSPGGALGHGLGIVGYALMLWAAFGYSWRKDPQRRGAGPARHWMRAHVAAGILGPSLVLLHTGARFHGLAGATAALMLVVVASGIVGRYVFTAIPRDGGAAPAHELARLDEEIAPLERAQRETLLESGGDGAASGGGALLLRQRAAASTAEARLRTLRAVREREARRGRRAVAAASARRVLAGWWVLHVPVSLAMLALGLVHALAALYYAAASR